MAILLTEDTRILVQGITGGEGTFHTTQMLEYNTKVVAGVTPGKGGQKWEGKLPIFDTVERAARETGANASVIFVPPAFAADAMLEAIDAGLKIIVAITEGVPVRDMVRVKNALNKSACRMVGPNCPGVISPGIGKMGIMPAFIHQPGKCGVISRSGTFTYEAVKQLSDRKLGQSTCIGIGGDPVNGTSFMDALRLFKDDPQTEAVVMIGEIGGSAEEEAAAYIQKEFRKPVAAFIAGLTAPPGRRMGHAGAIIAGGKGTATEKIKALRDAGIFVADSPGDIGATMAKALKR
ncbi:succinate--CoA ligase subunit alpha [bacterium]|nr:succinate--CoA ligase subunit alpha [bacterium]MBU1984907.1 succinate--CoA ligase subunit alpha [bacterium]